MGLSLRSLIKGIGDAVSRAVPDGGLIGRGVSSLVDSRGGGFPSVLNDDNPYIPNWMEFNPVTTPRAITTPGTCTDVPFVTTPGQRVVLSAPPGYVIVECRGQKVAMLKPIARSLGLWKPRRKPPISVKDWRCLQRADATIKKLKTVEKRAGMVQRARGRSTTKSRGRK